MTLWYNFAAITFGSLLAAQDCEPLVLFHVQAQAPENLWQNMVDAANGRLPPQHDAAQEAKDAVSALHDADVVRTTCDLQSSCLVFVHTPSHVGGA